MPAEAVSWAGRKIQNSTFTKHMLSRIGKIARLPANIRYQLNHRLLDNESGTHLLTWLNGLPEVQVMLEQYFDSRPINQQNLSAWRTGGFSEWRFRGRFSSPVSRCNTGTP